ncbi:MAG: hypothetical protein KDK04_29990 [Candidatus Competibacteraceae bacterium]|nr:hypothetical protein [Candidatus Competibacteraceae bacterium]MCB1815921.1 hypothetical protein [Candidatus Competibacteraceae bacterium]
MSPINLVEQMGLTAFKLVIYGIQYEKQAVSCDQITAFLKSQYPTAADHDIEASIDRACGIFLEHTRPLKQQAQSIQTVMEEFRYNLPVLNDFFKGDQDIDSS